MVQQRTDPWGGGRFAMLEMIREFVAGRTDAAVLRAAAARHRRHFLGELRRAGRPDAARLALDRPNVEQAMATAIGDGDRDAALGIALALRPLAEVRGLGPAMIELAGRVAADATVDAAQACRLHMMLAEALSAACRLDEAVTHGRRALELAGPGLERAEAAYVVARACWERDVTAIAHKAELERSLAVAEEAGAAHLQVRVLNLLGNVAVKDEGDLDRAEARYRQAAEVAQGNGLARLAAQARFNLGIVSRKRQSFRFALRCSDEVLRSCRERGDAMMLADALHERGVLLAEMHCWQEAVDALRDCIEHCWQHRAVTTLVYALWNLARPLARAGRAEEAARLIGFAAAYWERHGGPLSAHDRRYVRRVTGLAAAWIGAPRAAALADDGARLGLAEAVHLARAAPPSGGQPGVGRDGIGAPPAAAAARGS
jgi:tetratricopeptide (TPR) repeat protein